MFYSILKNQLINLYYTHNKDSMIDIDDYKEIRECDYNDEHYSVRDNGAVMRHIREGKRVRNGDNVWTFGKPDIRTGYMLFAGKRVHRIVACAFHGEPPTVQHVVDHIDTNRQNNRPENLRWLTRLENVLNNPITRARIENICGSIEVFLSDPSVLRGHEKNDPNFIWMKTVSLEEAHASLNNMLEWAKERPEPKGGKIGDWIYKEKKQTNVPYRRFNNFTDFNNTQIEETVINEDLFKTKSLTPNVIQIHWNTPSEFPCCPQNEEENPLEKYKQNLNVDSVFCKNSYYSCLVVDSALVDGGKKLIIMTENADENSIKPWAIASVNYDNGIYYHSSIGSYFSKDGAEKYFTIAQGKEWTGGDVFDDYC